MIFRRSWVQPRGRPPKVKTRHRNSGPIRVYRLFHPQPGKRSAIGRHPLPKQAGNGWWGDCTAEKAKARYRSNEPSPRRHAAEAAVSTVFTELRDPSGPGFSPLLLPTGNGMLGRQGIPRVAGEPAHLLGRLTARRHCTESGAIRAFALGLPHGVRLGVRRRSGYPRTPRRTPRIGVRFGTPKDD